MRRGASQSFYQLKHNDLMNYQAGSSHNVLHHNQSLSASVSASVIPGTPLYKCRECGRGFKYKPNLVIHERTHKGVYPYHCPYCNKGESATANLKSHMKRFHTGIEAFMCIHCKLEFKNVKQLKQHLDEGCPLNMQKQAQQLDPSSGSINDTD